MKVNIAKWPKRAVAAILAVLLAITFLPFSQLNITKAEEGPNSLSAETERYQATVSFGDDAGIPEGAYLVLTEFEEDSDEFVTAREAIINEDNGLNEDNLGMAAFDLTIYDADGVPIEPSAAVQVNIQMKELPSDVDQEVLEQTIAVQHLDESTGEVVVETVATSADDENGDVSIVDETAAAEFTVESFSTFVLTWGTEPIQQATIHFGTRSGNVFTEFEETTIAFDTNATNFSIANSFEGYTYRDAVYCADGTTIGDGVDIDSILTKTSSGWSMTQHVHGEGETIIDQAAPVADGSHIYATYYVPVEPTPVTPSGDIPKPTTEKTVTDNHDGTYTVQLDVTGAKITEDQSHYVNVLVVLDATSSMSGAKWTNAKSAMRVLVETLVEGDNAANAGKIDFALVTFGRSATVQRTNGDIWTRDNTAFKATCAGINMVSTSGTNWEAGMRGGLYGALNSVPDDDPTYVIFLTDGDPNTWYWNNPADIGAAIPNTRPTQYVSASNCGDADFYGASDTYMRPGYSGSSSTAANRSADEAKAIAANTKLYGIYCGDSGTTPSGPSFERLRDVIQGQGQGGQKTIAANADTIESEFQAIAETALKDIGANDVVVDDGIPALSGVSATTGGAASGFKYYKKPAPTEDVPEPTFSEWADAPGASYSQDNGVTWDLSEAGTLEAGATYRILFTVWPSQEAFDIVANLNNGTQFYSYARYEASLEDPSSALTEEEALAQGIIITEAERKQIKETAGADGSYSYSIPTNTHLKTTYTFKDETYADSPATLPSEDMQLESETMDILKVWNDAINDRNRADVVDFYLYELRDGVKYYYQKNGSFATAKDNAYKLTLTDNESPALAWRASIEIAPGVATAQSGVLNVLETGHKYALEEGGAYEYDDDNNLKPISGYTSEFTTQTVRPMEINGKLTYLVLVDDDNPKPAGATTYDIDGETYYVVEVAEGANGTLKGTNNKTPELDITKKIDEANSVTDKTAAQLSEEEFTYEIILVSPKGGDVSGVKYWIYSEAAPEADPKWTLPEYAAGAPGAGYEPYGYKYDPEDEENSTFYNGSSTNVSFEEPAEDGTQTSKTVTVTIKRGQVIRFTNLPTGTTYTITETNANGKTLAEQGYTVTAINSTATEKTVTLANATIEGTISETATRYYNQFVNQIKAVDAELKVTKALDGYAWDDGDDSYEFTLTATGTAPLPYKNASTDNKVTVSSASELTKSFGLIRFTAAGEYKYTITETKGTDQNIIYGDPVTVTVTVVEDSQTHKLSVTNITGTNTVFTAATTGENATPASANTTITNKIAGRDLTVTKTFSGIDALPSAFKIAVAYTDATGAKTAELKTTDEKVIVSEDGKTYTWTIEKVKPNTTVTAEEKDYAVDGYAVATGVTVDGVAAPSAIKAEFLMPNSDGTTVAFTNNYANVTINTKEKFFKKNVTTPNAVKDATFNFSAVQVDADGNAITGGWSKTGSVTYTAGASGEKNVDFGLITYTTAGTYYYKITETSLPKGWTATPTTKEATVTVVVTGSASEGLEATVTEASISNAYTPEPVTISFPVKKELVAPEGTSIPKGLSIKELFTLTLEAGTNTAGDGVETPVPTVKSYKNPDDDGGVVTFGDIEFTKAGTYNYTVKETGTVDGITNDTAATTGKTVTVTVVDDGEGTLSATASSTTAEPVTFTNTLAFGTLEITKDLSVYNDFVNSTTTAIPDNVTFTFEIVATWNGTQIYKDYKALTFAQAQASTITIANKLPIGSKVTIKEVYPGAGYKPEGSDTVTIDKMTTTASAAFKNAYNNKIIGGYGIENHFINGEYQDPEQALR